VKFKVKTVRKGDLVALGSVKRKKQGVKSTIEGVNRREVKTAFWEITTKKGFSKSCFAEPFLT
jgi:hypothetical protein